MPLVSTMRSLRHLGTRIRFDMSDTLFAFHPLIVTAGSSHYHAADLHTCSICDSSRKQYSILASSVAIVTLHFSIHELSTFVHYPLDATTTFGLRDINIDCTSRVHLLAFLDLLVALSRSSRSTRNASSSGCFTLSTADVCFLTGVHSLHMIRALLPDSQDPF